MTRGRKEITKLVRKKRENRWWKDTKEKIKEILELFGKRKINGDLERSVLAITSDGDDLKNTVTSPECLDLLLDFISDEDE